MNKNFKKFHFIPWAANLAGSFAFFRSMQHAAI